MARRVLDAAIARDKRQTERFGERWCRAGGLGIRPSTELLPILMANAGHLTKYGA